MSSIDSTSIFSFAPAAEPFFKINKKSRWDVYVIAKYGSCYLINYNENYFIPISGANYHKDELLPYRNEYGIGLGDSVYFWNIVGFNTEFSFGQFSYWPRIFSSNFNDRAGIVFKFNTNQEIKNDNIQGYPQR